MAGKGNMGPASTVSVGRLPLAYTPQMRLAPAVYTGSRFNNNGALSKAINGAGHALAGETVHTKPRLPGTHRTQKPRTATFQW